MLRFRRRYGPSGAAYGPVVHFPLSGYDFYLAQLYMGPSMPGRVLAGLLDPPDPREHGQAAAAVLGILNGSSPFDVLSGLTLRDPEGAL